MNPFWQVVQEHPGWALATALLVGVALAEAVRGVARMLRNGGKRGL